MASNVQRQDGLGRRVVVTGMAGFSPIGNDWPSIKARLERLQNGVIHMDDRESYDGLNTRSGARTRRYLACALSSPGAAQHGPRRANGHACQ